MSTRYDDGAVEIYNLKNAAEPAAMPVYKLERFMFTESFAEKQIGLTRQYLSKGVDEQIDLLIQILAGERRPRIGQIAVITEWNFQEDPLGDQFRINNVQPTQDEGLDVFLLTLQRLGENYDYIE